MSRLAAVPLLLAVMLATACTGEPGSTGPMGPAGQIGPPGPPANRMETTGQYDSSGTTKLNLPFSAVQDGTYPVVSCYTSPNPFTWITVSGTDCILNTDNQAANTPPYVWMAGSPGWFYYIVALW